MSNTTDTSEVETPAEPTPTHVPIKEYAMMVGVGVLIICALFVFVGFMSIGFELWVTFGVPYLTPHYQAMGIICAAVGLVFTVTYFIAIWRSEVSTWKYLFSWLPFAGFVTGPEQSPPNNDETKVIDVGAAMALMLFVNSCIYILTANDLRTVTDPKQFEMISVMMGTLPTMMLLVFVAMSTSPLGIHKFFRLAYGTQPASAAPIGTNNSSNSPAT